jgi:diguanylate cyclase (GGDEF)-like protein
MPLLPDRWSALALASAAVSVAAMLAAPALPAVVVWDVAWTAAAVTAVAGGLAARRRATGPERGRWNWWTAAAVSWLLGQCGWNLFAATGAPASPNPADIGWWGFAILVMVGLVRVPARGRTLRLVAVVEALPLIVAAMALTSAVLWHDAERSSLPPVQRVAVLIYPALYVAAAVLTLQALVSGPLRRREGAGLRLVLIGMAIEAVTFSLWSEQLLDTSYTVGATLVDPLFAAGMLAIGAGGVAVARAPQRSSRLEEPGDRGGFLPAAMFLGLVIHLIQASFGHPPLGVMLVLSGGLATSGATLIARAALLVRRQRGLLAAEQEARRELAARETQLQRLNAQLAEDSRRDTLTGLRNRRALEEDIRSVEAQALRRGGSFAVALCDVDRFKTYNDRLGHLAGDDALRALARAIEAELRAGDVAYRYGGEELIVVLADAAALDAVAAAERVRAAIATLGLPHPQGGHVTVSIGVAAGERDAPALLARADAALYSAKRGGRDRVVAAAADEAVGPVRHQPVFEPPVVRQLRSVTAVSRAASERTGLRPVLETLAQTIRAELRFSTVVVNLANAGCSELEAAVVLGDDHARDLLLGSRTPWSMWEPMLAPMHERCGAYWLPSGSHDWDDDMPTWRPSRAHDAPDAWDPNDALLLPLRGSNGSLLGVVAVDDPLTGRRPHDDDLTVLMAVADHAALVIEQIQHEEAALAAVGRIGAAERLAAVMLLAETLDLRDAGTADHSRTVGEFAAATAAALGLEPERVERLRAAGVLHDLGKLAVRDATLHKPGKLDDEEWREIRRHPEVGAQVLAHAGLGDIAAWVRGHHERLDGRGYPDGLSGDAIPLEARILAVADAYEAMIADRPYRAGMAAAEAREELERCAGTQFDADVVRAFLGTQDVPAPLPVVTLPAAA